MLAHPVAFPTDLETANSWIKEYRAEVADLREALAFVKAERDHWRDLVPRADRVQFPFHPSNSR